MERNEWRENGKRMAREGDGQGGEEGTGGKRNVQLNNESTCKLTVGLRNLTS